MATLLLTGKLSHAGEPKDSFWAVAGGLASSAASQGTRLLMQTLRCDLFEVGLWELAIQGDPWWLCLGGQLGRR